MACLNDGSLGPSVNGCRGDFDFTLNFERVFFTIIPSAVFIALVAPRVAVLAQCPRVVRGAIIQYMKLAFAIAYSATQLGLLVFFADRDSKTIDTISVVSSVLAFVASLFVVGLSFMEHAKAKRPSVLLNAYLFLTLLFDAIQTRTAWLNATSSGLVLARLLTASVALKLAVLLLEAIPKTRWIVWDRKEHSPEESSGLYDLGVYYWLNTLFVRGYRGVLKLEDLYPLDWNMASHELHRVLESNLHVQGYKDSPKFGLVKDLCRTLPGPFLLPVVPRVALLAFKFCQPFFIDATLDYLSQPNAPRSHGFGLIGASGLIYTGIAVSSALYNYYNQRAVYMVRGCLAAAIFRKTTQVKISAADDSAAITLMSTDVERIVRGGQFVHEIWANLIETAVGCWLLNNKLGAAFVSPVIIIIVCSLLLSWVLSVAGKKQGDWMNAIQNRVGLTANAISHMKLFKISGITGTVAELIQRLRDGEIKVGHRFRWLLLAAAVLGYCPLLFSPPITFAVTSSHLDTNTLFTSISYIILLSVPLASLFQSLPAIFAALTCTQRIQRFLESDPRVDFRHHKTQVVSTSSSEKDDSRDEPWSGSATPAFTIDKGSFGWDNNSNNKMTLSEIGTSIPANRLTMIVGPVASGKSTLCKVLLGEVPLALGQVTAHVPMDKIAYCEQTPFLYNATFKENIVGHCLFDQKKYDEIIEATMLNTDAALLSQGHETKIGSNGIMLSGGQRQRVSVARALYSEADIMIFDDILSGLDNDTEAELFRRVFGDQGITRQRKATVIICTHSVHNLPSADHIVALGTEGTVIEQGTFQDLMQNNMYIQSLGVKEGSITESTSSKPENKEIVAEAKPSTAQASQEPFDDKSRQNGDWTIYVHFVKSSGIWLPVSLLLTGMGFGFCNNFSTVWLKYWAEDRFSQSAGFYIGILALLRGGQMLSLTFNAFSTYFVMIATSGSVLHKRAITTVISAPLKFFTTTDSGVVTNLFSQDMTLLDGDLPQALTNLSLDASDTIAMAFVIASASPYLAVGYPILFGVLYFVQKFYLRTSRQMRLLDLEAKSPLYTHFIDTIKGLATIRAFGWQKADVVRNNKLLDTSQRPAYLLAMIQQWLMSTMQLIVAGLAVVLISLATQLRANTGLTGASLVTLLTFSETISSLIRSYTLLETSLGAVSRLRTFSETVQPEDLPGEDLEPPESWPETGRIDIKGVSASYDAKSVSDEVSPASQPPAKLVLRDLNISILPGQKVAICGRTGSGKSTLILLLLRLLDPLSSCSENIELDGLPLHAIDRSTLRKRIIAIPQDAVFLPDGSTIKSNIDPLQVATDDACLSVLDLVHLSGFVQDHGGLNAGMSADDLSAGQKQLFSLARAILRKRVRERRVVGEQQQQQKSRGILLLDEVSSSVDKVTDRKMQEIIKQEFEQYTIVMVSHRLEMVMDFFDRVVVLDKGAVVEEGSPRVLVENDESRFKELWVLGKYDR